VIGQTLSRYKVLEVIGEGGMGVVYEAQDIRLGRLVALEFLSPDLTRDSDARDRFIHEAQAASDLRPPFIYFPLEGHCEQQITVAKRFARHKAGTMLMYSEMTTEILAEKITSHIGREVTWPPIRTDGAERAAKLINQMLTGIN
jgi:serine/threonine protein kinase